MKRLILAFIIFMSYTNAYGIGYVKPSIGLFSSTDSTIGYDVGFDIAGGLQLTDSLAMEISYIRLDEFELDNIAISRLNPSFGTAIKRAGYVMSGFQASIIGSAQLDDAASIFGRVGIFSWDMQLNIDVVGGSLHEKIDNDNTLSYGVGFKLKETKNLSLILEFNRYKVIDIYINSLNAGIRVDF
jgi:hypothetical protein